MSDKNLTEHPKAIPPEKSPIAGKLFSSTVSTSPFTWRQLMIVLLVVGIAFFLWKLAPILTPFLLGAGFAYIMNPVVNGLNKVGLPRWAAVSLVFLVLTLFAAGLVVLVAPLLVQQAEQLYAAAPEYLANLDRLIRPYLAQWFGIEGEINVETIRNFVTENKDTLSTYVGNALRSGLGLVGAILGLLILPVVIFYLLLDWPNFIAKIKAAIPRDIEPTVTHLAKESDNSLAAFLRGQLLVMLSLAIMYSVGLWIAGVPYALFIGVTAGLVSFVPYLGNLVGVGLAVIVVLMQGDGFLPLLYVAIVFGTGQLVEGMILTPWLVGDRINLHPLVVIFAVMAGGQLFGFAGVLLALPAAAVLAVIVRYVYSRYENSELYTG